MPTPGPSEWPGGAVRMPRASSPAARASPPSSTRAEAELGAVQQQLEQWQLGLPNLLHASGADGDDASANAEVRRWGEPRDFALAIRN